MCQDLTELSDFELWNIIHKGKPNGLLTHEQRNALKEIRTRQNR